MQILGKYQHIIKHGHIISVHHLSARKLENMKFRCHCVLQFDVLNFGSDKVQVLLDS